MLHQGRVRMRVVHASQLQCRQCLPDQRLVSCETYGSRTMLLHDIQRN